MPDILIRNVPAALHSRLKAAAASHRRSVTQETIMLLDQALTENPKLRSKLPEPLKLAGPPLTNDEVLGMIDDGLEPRGLAQP